MLELCYYILNTFSMLELCYYILNTFSQNPLLDVRQVYKLHTDSVWYDYSSEERWVLNFIDLL